MSLSLTLQPHASKLHNLSLFEPINPVIFDKLMNSSLLMETWNKTNEKDYENERHQLNEYKKLIKKSSNKLAKKEYAKVKYIKVKGMKFGRTNPVRGLGLHNIRREIRHTLAKEFLEDIDVKNAHPSMLYQILKSNKLEFIANHLKEYIVNRDQYLTEVSTHYSVSKDDAKTLFIRLLYCGGITNWRTKCEIPDTVPDLSFIEGFKAEFAHIASVITNHNPLIKKEVEKVKKEKGIKEYNIDGSVISFYLQEYECRVLENCYLYCCNNGYIVDNIACLCADGLMIEKDKYTPSLLTELQEHIKKTLDFELTFTNKEMDKDYLAILDDNLLAVEEKPEENGDTLIKNSPNSSVEVFKVKAPEFEKNHAKILNSSVFIKDTPSKVIVMSKTQITTSYEHIECGFSQMGNPVNFISKWLSYNDKIRQYDTMEIYPDASKCPSNVFNLWRPFAMELLKDEPYTPKPDALQLFLNHIHILCNREKEVSDYLTKWIAQMIQFPEIKTVCPTLISKQGAGKNTIINGLRKVMGTDKVVETTRPSRDVWGSFNGMMVSSFLVNLDELSKKEQEDADGQIKGLITNPTLWINQKGVNQFPILSYHRFIITTNNEDPVKTSEDDRRNFIIRSSDELIGNKEYFDNLYALLDDVNVLRTIYDYFKSVPDMENFHKIKLPKTEYHKELVVSNRPVPDLWLEDFTRSHYNRDTMELSSVELLEYFNFWCEKNNMKYETNSIKLTVKIKNMNIPGISKGRKRTNGCDLSTTKFDIETLKMHYKLECLVDV